MSRAKQQSRRKRRKEKKRGRGWQPAAHATATPSNPRFADAQPVVADLRLLKYAISFEALDRPEETRNAAFNEAMPEIRERLFDQVHSDPASAIPVLEGLLDRFPDEPTLMNWLSAAHGRNGDFDAASRIAQRNFEVNPHYLFARINWAQMRLEEGDLQAVEEIFDKKFDLQLLYPDRDVFHISEFTALTHMVITYWLKKGDYKPARLLFDTLDRIAPNHEATRALRGAIQGSYLIEAARKFAQSTLRRGEVPYI